MRNPGRNVMTSDGCSAGSPARSAFSIRLSRRPRLFWSCSLSGVTTNSVLNRAAGVDESCAMACVAAPRSI